VKIEKEVEVKADLPKDDVKEILKSSKDDNTRTEVQPKEKEEEKYERILQTFGHVEDDENSPACGHCVQQKEVLEKIKENNIGKIKIEEYDIYKDELGKRAFQKKKVQVIPTTYDCPIDPETGKVKEKECVEIQGFNENYFKKYLPNSTN
jgi:thiol-disulfide isomerase/thioredoxin